MSVIIECYNVKFNWKGIDIEGWNIVYCLLIMAYKIIGYYD